MARGSRSGETYKPGIRYPFLRLLWWMAHDEEARQIKFLFKGTQPVFSTSNKPIQPGSELELGTKSGVEVTTGFISETQTHLFTNAPEQKPSRRLNPVTPAVSFWINFVELLKILRAQGIEIRHPDTGKVVFYEDIQVGDRVWKAYEQARQDYERDVMPPLEELFSTFVSEWYKVESKDRSLPAAETATPVDELESILKALPAKDREYVKSLVKSKAALKPVPPPSKLAGLVQGYMQDSNLESAEDVAYEFISWGYDGDVEAHPIYQPIADCLNKILSGWRPTPDHPGTMITMQNLRRVLRKGNGDRFKDDQEILDYCWSGSNNPGNHISTPEVKTAAKKRSSSYRSGRLK